MRGRRSGVFLAMVLAVAGCSDPAGPGEVVAGGLPIGLEVAPSSIGRQETLVATLTLENLTAEPVELVSACTALALIKAFRGGQRVDLEGTVLGCGDALTPFTIGAGETLTRTHEVRAVRFDGEPVERGIYELRAELMVPDLPDLKATFRVE